jgi:DNA-binding response OmpR family regulator
MPNQKILVTNHDPTYLEMIQDLLQLEGYLEIICVAAEAVLATAEAEQPGLILIDLHIGVAAQAWRSLDLLRLHPATTEIPIIICSTDPRLPVEKAQMLERLRCYYLEKPFNLETLLALLETIIGPPKGT